MVHTSGDVGERQGGVKSLKKGEPLRLEGGPAGL